MYVEAQSLNPIKLFTLIMVYKQSSTKTVISSTFLSVSLFMCRRQGREGAAAG